jgi:hypothetical protein
MPLARAVTVTVTAGRAGHPSPTCQWTAGVPDVQRRGPSASGSPWLEGAQAGSAVACMSRLLRPPLAGEAVNLNLNLKVPAVAVWPGCRVGGAPAGPGPGFAAGALAHRTHGRRIAGSTHPWQRDRACGASGGCWCAGRQLPVQAASTGKSTGWSVEVRVAHRDLSAALASVRRRLSCNRGTARGRPVVAAHRHPCGDPRHPCSPLGRRSRAAAPVPPA